MVRKNLNKAKLSGKPSQQEVFQAKINHDELTEIMKAATVLRRKDKENKKIETKMRKLEEDLKNPRFAMMMQRLFPMANLTVDQIDRRAPLKTLQKLCMGFEKSLKEQRKSPVKSMDKIGRETELLHTLKTLLKNKTDNIKLKAENRLLREKRETLLSNKKYSNITALKKLRLTKLKEELEETDQQVNSILDQNAKLFKDVENLYQDKQRQLKFERGKRELWSYLRHRYCNEISDTKFLRKKKNPKKKMLELEF
ncbi:hypothetical protein ZYGR_0I05460 [Zygosaccharomyces rouxii]|uniref:ZYRO0C12892p n=2 Tax=Zygosaccharomyces rouxii TaxID=4956 RepID=C5DU11_ZYGRC|nr:uncharacterized protein ZYRO0C12892g [Zygosaccharomyces rouxii]GAV48249.1 hypothetical protein ZYGR_0I05460 [Zygosaccharomyces rouxii]CAR27272.1 ZYRO0C12892p [Zygosaccharomyces rouxii]